MLLSNKKKGSSHENTWKKLKGILYQVKQANLESLCMKWFQLYVILVGLNFGDDKKSSGCQGLGGRDQEVEPQRILRAVKLFGAVDDDDGYVTSCMCQKAYNATAWRVSPKVNYELQLMMIYQYWLISDNKGPTIMQDVNNRGTWGTRRRWRKGHMGEIFLLSIHFFGTLKLL